MKHPLQYIPAGWPQWVALIILICLVALIGNKATGPRRPELPHIVQLELSWNQQRAQQVLAAWDKEGTREAFRTAVYWDYLFILVYPLALGLACIMASKTFPSPALRGERFVGLLAYALCLAGILDMIENVGLLMLIGGSQSPTWPLVSSICSSVKFLIIVVGVVYFLVGMYGGVYQRFTPVSPADEA